MKIIINPLSSDEMQAQGMTKWPIWTCPVSEFPWKYDSKETCYILEGEVEVETAQETVRFSAGDMVVFPRGLECNWKVLQPVRKHYLIE